jgi:hypothetical protein
MLRWMRSKQKRDLEALSCQVGHRFMSQVMVKARRVLRMKTAHVTSEPLFVFFSARSYIEYSLYADWRIARGCDEVQGRYISTADPRTRLFIDAYVVGTFCRFLQQHSFIISHTCPITIFERCNFS